MKFKQQMVASAKLVMKITIVQTFFAIIFMCALYAKEAKSQNVLEKKITLSVKNVPLKEVIKLIKSQTKVDFSFSESVLNSDITITCSVKHKTLLDFFDNYLVSYNIGYRVVNDQIVLFQRNELNGAAENAGPQVLPANPTPAVIVITGYVYDDAGLPLPGGHC